MPSVSATLRPSEAPNNIPCSAITAFMDPKVINYLKETSEAISFYYSVQDRKTGIKITFAIIYILIVSLLLFLSVNIAINKIKPKKLFDLNILLQLSGFLICNFFI